MLPHHPLLSPLSKLTGSTLQPGQFKPIGGGSINEVYLVETDKNNRFCCKVNSASKFPQLFPLEAKGLMQLQPHIKVPEVIGWGEEAGFQYLLLQWVNQDTPTSHFWKSFGAALAALHAVKGPYYGAAENNFMGSVSQNNEPSDDWGWFFAQRRLLPIAQKCQEAGLLRNNELSQVESLVAFVPGLFEAAAPSLLHGDLWSGNYLCGSNNQPVLIDPAVYYGHPAVDLAMTTLFGGFDRQFYEAYHFHAPLSSHHKEQWEICNLYPLLIHLLLFGTSYLHPIRKTLQRFVGSH